MSYFHSSNLKLELQPRKFYKHFVEISQVKYIEYYMTKGAEIL